MKTSGTTRDDPDYKDAHLVPSSCPPRGSHAVSEHRVGASLNLQAGLNVGLVQQAHTSGSKSPTPATLSRLQSSGNTSLSESIDDDYAPEITDYSERSTAGSEEFQFLKVFGLAVAKNVLTKVRRFVEEHAGIVSHTGPSTPSSCRRGQTTQITTPLNSAASSTGKRTREEAGSGIPNGDGSGDGPDKRPKVNGFSSLSPPLLRKFACPYYKRYPERHRKWRSCSGPGWDTIHRLKLV